MKRTAVVSIMLLLTVLVLFTSCELLMSDAFQDVKEKNVFKSFEDIPYFPDKEMTDHLRPYGEINNEVVTFSPINDSTMYRMQNIFTSEGLVIKEFSISNDITEYIEKVNIMITNDTLGVFTDEGGSVSALLENLHRIAAVINDIKDTVNGVGFTSLSVETQVNTNLNQIIADADAAAERLREEGIS